MQLTKRITTPLDVRRCVHARFIVTSRVTFLRCRFAQKLSIDMYDLAYALAEKLQCNNECNNNAIAT